MPSPQRPNVAQGGHRGAQKQMPTTRAKGRTMRPIGVTNILQAQNHTYRKVMHNGVSIIIYPILLKRPKSYSESAKPIKTKMQLKIRVYNNIKNEV